eukprot:scaffold287800_cov43-Tisochrysis_lutea.AAC.2
MQYRNPCGTRRHWSRSINGENILQCMSTSSASPLLRNSREAPSMQADKRRQEQGVLASSIFLEVFPRRVGRERPRRMHARHQGATLSTRVLLREVGRPLLQCNAKTTQPIVLWLAHVLLTLMRYARNTHILIEKKGA